MHSSNLKPFKNLKTEVIATTLILILALMPLRITETSTGIDLNGLDYTLTKIIRFNEEGNIFESYFDWRDQLKNSNAFNFLLYLFLYILL